MEPRALGPEPTAPVGSTQFTHQKLPGRMCKSMVVVWIRGTQGSVSQTAATKRDNRAPWRPPPLAFIASLTSKRLRWRLEKQTYGEIHISCVTFLARLDSLAFAVCIRRRQEEPVVKSYNLWCFLPPVGVVWKTTAAGAGSSVDVPFLGGERPQNYPSLFVIYFGQ